MINKIDAKLTTDRHLKAEPRRDLQPGAAGGGRTDLGELGRRLTGRTFVEAKEHPLR